MLSTCNRSEIYVASADSGRAREELLVFLGELRSSRARRFCRICFPMKTPRLRTICSASPPASDSLVLGEPQILGQVKDAFQAAAERRCTGRS